MQEYYIVNNRRIPRELLFSEHNIQWTQYCNKGNITSTKFKKRSCKKIKTPTTTSSTNASSSRTSNEQSLQVTNTKLPSNDLNKSNHNNNYAKISPAELPMHNSALKQKVEIRRHKIGKVPVKDCRLTDLNECSTSEFKNENELWKSERLAKNERNSSRNWKENDDDSINQTWAVENMNRVVYSNEEDSLRTFMEIRQNLLNSFFSWNDTVVARIKSLYEDLQYDFTEIEEETREEKKAEESIDALQIRRNLIRVADLTDSIGAFINEAKRIFKWENPAVSFIVFILYMHTVYKGWLLTVIMLTITSIFLYFYFQCRQTNGVINHTNSPQPGPSSMNLKSQVALTVYVLKKYQLIARVIREMLEKIKNLFMWRPPEMTQFVFTVTVVCTLCTFLLSATQIFNIIAYYMGLYAFVLQNLFLRFPRLARKYDKATGIWNQLLTDEQYNEWTKKQGKKEFVKKQELGKKNSISSLIKEYDFSNSAKSKSNNLSSMLKVPLPEPPLPEWNGGRRCTIETKSSFFGQTTTQGLIYITERYLCFESSEKDESNASFIPLDIITKVDKVNIYNSFIGGGKGISVSIPSAKKVLTILFQAELFSSILNRDEAYESIMKIGRRHRYPWIRINKTS